MKTLRNSRKIQKKTEPMLANDRTPQFMQIVWT